MFVQPSGKSKHTRSILATLRFQTCISYTDNHVTEAEFNFLPQRIQEQMKRAAVNNLATSQPNPGSWYHHQAPPSRYRRVGAFYFSHIYAFLFLIFVQDWLRERIYFEGLRKDDDYVQSRLGFKAPNIFVMDLVP
jgi:hypothetical protein